MKKRKLLKTGLAVTLAVMTLAQPVSAANWVHNNTGWWWREDNGSYPANQWKAINGTWYWFDSNGYMATGWRKINGTWYWMDASGAMATGWRNIGGKWYWMDASGAMATGWRNINGTWYYLESSGAMASNKWIGNYYVEASGAMATNKWIGNYYVNGSGLWTQTRTTGQWISSGNRWWYRHSDGTYTRNGWETIAGTDYLFDGSGWMLTGWQSVNGTWYYMNSSGGKVTNQWVGNYYVDGSGAWVETKGQHHWNNGVETIAATCNKAGSKTYTCTVCGEKKTESIPATENHNWKTHEAKGHEEKVLVKKAWDEPLYDERYICNGCGKQFKTDDEALDHIMSTDITSVCQNYSLVTVQVDTLHHDDFYVTKWIVDEKGYDECTVCGKTKHTHAYDDGVVTREPSCKSKGEKTFTCRTCGDTYTESIPTSEAHIYNDGVVSTAPTCDKEGVKIFACMRCDAIKKESIPALGHAWHHHDAEGHWETVTVKEPWEETVYESRYICNGCGAEFKTNLEAGKHVAASGVNGTCHNYHAEKVPVKIKHEAETKQVYVIDKKAYDECDRCHIRKDAE
ncbi:MAG: hypothetical protein MR035_09355 [Dorea longicatena]|nr:hypothetical protein [Dorea longicatena]